MAIMKDPLCGMPLDPEKAKYKVEIRGKTCCFCSERCMRIFLERPYYFSMEVGIKSEIPTYSGGLGVLAGDTIRSSADLRIPLVAITLVSRKGYLRQKITDRGEQLEYPDEWTPSEHMDLLSAGVNVRIGGRDVKVRAWLYEHTSLTGGIVPILFLDTDVEGNATEDREITNLLYGGDDTYRLKQEIILGIGGIRMLEALDFNIRNYHMNEGHSSLLTVDIPGWANEPELLVRVDGIPNDEIWGAHMKAKKDLIDFVNEKTASEMDASTLSIGFARRATAYKRTTLIFSDLDRLREISKRGNLQLIFAGKAHPRDELGKKIIREIASKLTSGVDLWLNTPLPPLEASGTSGMKAAHNGVVNFSILDGWWTEGCIEGETGWSIGPPPNEPLGQDERRRQELKDLYNKLEYLVVPTFYKKRDDWVHMMENSIGKVTYYFNSHRMMRRYVTDAYLL